MKKVGRRGEGKKVQHIERRKERRRTKVQHKESRKERRRKDGLRYRTESKRGSLIIRRGDIGMKEEITEYNEVKD